MAGREHLKLVGKAELGDRGRLLSAREVALECFQGRVSEYFVRRHVRPRIVLGPRTVRWWEKDAIAWRDKHITEQ